VSGPQSSEPIWFVKWQWPQENSIEHAEDRGRRGNAQRNDDNGGDREAWRFSETPHRVHKLTNRLTQDRAGSSVTRLFLDGVQMSEGPPSGSVGVLG
jgi:hypothetical protein